jgi:phosphate transport system protein
MASLVEDILEEAGEAVSRADHALATRVTGRDEDVDAEEVQVEKEVIRLLALYQPVGSDLRLLCTILKVNNDLERIADCAVNVAERARHVDPAMAADGIGELDRMIPIVRQMLRHAVQAYSTQSSADAQRVFQDEEAVDALYGQVIRRVVVDAARSPEYMASYLDLLSVAKNLERIADHTTNIAEDVVYLTTGEIVRHRSA